MELGTRDTLLTVATSVLMLAGIAMVLFLRDSVMTMVGIVLVTLAAIVFIVDAKDLIVKTDQNARD
jgi:ABC-type bacteriocin/lantibiotic exporter with double-glycine peptidase domain